MQNTQEVFRVARRTSQEELFTQPLGPWFRHGLISRTAWIAVNTDLSLAGQSVQVQLESLCSNGTVSGWNVVFSSGDTELFRYEWPTRVLELTALTVSQQCENARVLYWVTSEEVTHPSSLQIDFGPVDEEWITLPQIAARRVQANGHVVSSCGGYRSDVVVELSQAAFESLTQGIADGSKLDKELAFAGNVTIERSPEGTLFYQLASFDSLRSPDATAALCPISPEELVGMYQTQGPFVFLHTHIVGEGAGDASSSLACSQNDLRTFYRLPIGSLGIVAASRLPLRIRVYGWLGDGILSDLSATMSVVD